MTNQMSLERWMSEVLPNLRAAYEEAVEAGVLGHALAGAGSASDGSFWQGGPEYPRPEMRGLGGL